MKKEVDGVPVANWMAHYLWKGTKHETSRRQENNSRKADRPNNGQDTKETERNKDSGRDIF